MYSIGIDIGSRNTKVVVFDYIKRSILHSSYRSSEVDTVRCVDSLISDANAVLRLGDIKEIPICATGYGRKLYKSAQKVLSEISCHAVGCNYFFPRARSIIDIGGQDSKVIALDSNGRVLDFIMNDKCAAGTGRFLEMASILLETPLESLSKLAGNAELDLNLSSTCVVFAESEIIGLLSKGHNPSDISHSVNMSIAKRIYSQMAPLKVSPPVVFTGGVAQIKDLSLCIERLIDVELLIPPDPEITGALGAAIMAHDV